MLRNPVKSFRPEAAAPEYTREQKQAIQTFQTDYKKGLRKTYLLYGVTGSGKTEVYMEMIETVVGRESRRSS